MTALNSVPAAESNSQLAVAVGGSADAIGTHTLTQGTTETIAAGGMGIGVAAFVAAAQDPTGKMPQAAVMSAGSASGGDTVGLVSDSMSLSFPHGASSVAAAASLAFVASSEPGALSWHNGFSSLVADLHTIA